MDLTLLESQFHRAGLQNRPAQMDMIQACFDALKAKDILCIEAPTGTGKTLSYAIAAFHAKQNKSPVVISTATIALQEQLYHKDLPLLAKLLGVEISFVMAKGRRRYVCLSRLYGPEAQDDLFSAHPTLERMQEAARKHRWDGDRDQLAFPVEEALWQRVSTDRAGCSGNLCDQFEDCLYYKARKKAHVSDFIITNHSLLLSDCELGGGAILPEPENCCYIIDECHHLPDKALDHFAKHATVLGATEWVNGLTRTLTKAASAQIIEQARVDAFSKATQTLVTSLKNMQAFLEDHLDAFDQTQWHLLSIPPALLELATALRDAVEIVCQQSITLIGKTESHLDKLTGLEKESTAKLLNNLQFYQGRADNALDAWTAFCQPRAPKSAPIARWFEKQPLAHRDDTWTHHFTCHCAQINVSEQLKKDLWDKAPNGIILCSATLRALGKFDDFRRRTGLKNNPRLKEIQIDAFFDFSRSVLFIPKMRHTPLGKDQAAHRDEVIQLMPDLILPKSGTLVLFTSRSAMEYTFDHLPNNLQKDILVQGDQNKNKLIEKHKTRIRRGRRSILFGLASFGEGLDLPADFCEHVIIHKLPFAVPSTPVERTRNDWLEQNQLNAFQLATLPATSIRLTQFVGRLIRQETDTGIVTILDSRLITKSYGQALLDNLPHFKQLLGVDINTFKQDERVAELYQNTKAHA